MRRRVVNRAVMALSAVCLVSIAACSSSTTTGIVDGVSDEHLIRQASVWTNMLGLEQSDPVVWRERFERACSEGVWDTPVATQLAQEFIDQDEAILGIGGLGFPHSVENGAQAMWIMTVEVCRDAFPAGEIEEGPPFL